MEYFKHINLPSWPMLQKFCHESWDKTFTQVHIFKGLDIRYIAQLVEKDLLQLLGQQYKVKSAIMFINDAYFEQEIHIDGFNIDRKDASNTALNIPILNCETSPMFWLDGKYKLKQQDTQMPLSYLQLDWETEPTIVANAVINQPTVVRIDVPHCIKNLTDSPRLMLSIRFVNDIPLVNIP